MRHALPGDALNDIPHLHAPFTHNSDLHIERPLTPGNHTDDDFPQRRGGSKLVTHATRYEEAPLAEPDGFRRVVGGEIEACENWVQRDRNSHWGWGARGF